MNFIQKPDARERVPNSFIFMLTRDSTNQKCSNPINDVSTEVRTRGGGGCSQTSIPGRRTTAEC